MLSSYGTKTVINESSIVGRISWNCSLSVKNMKFGGKVVLNVLMNI